ncbi:MAG: hypothetical protein ABSB74_18095 [Tepidisphaeraceae bacterium]
MTRSYDTIPNELNRSAEVAKPLAPVMSVCPFCGAISEKTEGPCARCKMENSAMTRQATRARVGPWYVMQSRNPSAPGMKCSTLLALIRKGQISPRSVIRGPTTYQLWRFAARVKGISREFGLCYSCGGEVQRTSTFCARCSRSQELPPNPDALLEHETQAAKAVYRDVKAPRPPTPASVERPRPETAQAEPLRPAADAQPDPLRGGRSQTQIPSAAETMAELAELPSPHNAPSEMQTRPRQRPQEGVLSARELAAAFSLQYDPTMDVPGSRRRRGGVGKRLIAVAAMFVVFGGTAATFYYVPSLRQRIINWVQDASPPAGASSDTHAVISPPQKPLSVQTPTWMMPPPIDSPPITTPVATAPKQPGDVAALSYNLPPVPKPTAVEQPASVVQPSHDSQPASPSVATNIVVPGPNDARTAAAAANSQKLRQSAAGDLDTLAMQLRGNGLDAEHREDFAAAEYYYQQVEQLPRDHWPGDIDQLLKVAHQRVIDGDAH